MPSLSALARFILLLVLFALRSSHAQTTIPVPMKADRWISAGNAAFTSGDHATDGVLEVTKGAVDVKDLIFGDGTIEFDMYMPDHGILGIRLRAQSRENAEALYFRPQKIATLLPIACSTCPWSMVRSNGTYSRSIKRQRQFRL